MLLIGVYIFIYRVNQDKSQTVLFSRDWLFQYEDWKIYYFTIIVVSISLVFIIYLQLSIESSDLELTKSSSISSTNLGHVDLETICLTENSSTAKHAKDYIVQGLALGVIAGFACPVFFPGVSLLLLGKLMGSAAANVTLTVLAPVAVIAPPENSFIPLVFAVVRSVSVLISIYNARTFVFFVPRG